MRLTSPSEVRAALQELGLEPRAALGQSFLIDANIRDLIVDAAGIGPADTVLEIGPGLGVLTERLLERGAVVVAVEKDPALGRHLTRRWGGRPGFRLIEKDFLALDPAALLAAEGVTAVVSNLPYSVASRILMELVTLRDPPATVVVTVQLEVAERLAARPGDHARSLLSVWTQLAYAVTIRKRVSATCFFPVPRVRSAVVQMVRRGDGIGAPHRAAYYALSRHAFARRRKQMATALSHPGPLAPPLSKEKAVRGLRAAGLDPRIRAEALEVADWLRLAAWYAAEGGGRGAVPREG